MKARDPKAQEAVNGAYGSSYAVALDGEILAMSGTNCHGGPGSAQGSGDHGSGASGPSPTFVDWDLFSVIQGADVRGAYRAIHENVIVNGRAVSFEYRSDTPDTVRRMRMVISPFTAADGTTAALYQSQLLEARRRIPLPFLDRMRRLNAADLPVVSECAWCARVDAGGGWRKPEQYYADGGASEVRLTHGLCPSCAATIVAPLLDTEAWSHAA